MWAEDIARLARAAARHDPSLAPLAARVTALRSEHDGAERDGGTG